MWEEETQINEGNRSPHNTGALSIQRWMVSITLLLYLLCLLHQLLLLLFHSYSTINRILYILFIIYNIEIVTGENDVSSCFGSTMAEALPLCPVAAWTAEWKQSFLGTNLKMDGVFSLHCEIYICFIMVEAKTFACLNWCFSPDWLKKSSWAAFTSFLEELDFASWS